jgi:hypothetical protein
VRKSTRQRQTVGTPEEARISENTGTKNSRRTDSSGKHRNTEAPSGKRRNIEEPELPTCSETPEVRLKRKISGNLDIRKKESRRPMQNRRPELLSKTGSRNQATEDAGKAWSLEGPEPNSRSARKASSWAWGGVLRDKLNIGKIGWVSRGSGSVWTDRLGEPWKWISVNWSNGERWTGSV